MTATLSMQRDSPTEPEVLPFAIAIAVVAHVALAVLSPTHAAPRADAPPPLEVELAPPPKPETPPPPPPKAMEPDRAPEPTRAHVQAPRPAAAGRILAAEGPAAANDAPLDFVTDPNGQSYGFGVVSRGGSATGAGQAAPVIAAKLPEGPPKPAAPELVRPEDLSERPRLSTDDPCRGYYPGSASVDSAEAVVRVVLDDHGGVRSTVVVSENPRGEGFGAAAKQCIGRQRFSTARDRAGKAVATAMSIRVHFVR